MIAGNYDFSIDQGATVQFGITYTLADCTPFDLTGYSGWMKILATPTASAQSTDSYYTQLTGQYDNCNTNTNTLNDFYNSLPSIFTSGSIMLSSSINPDGTGLNFSGCESSLPPSSGSICIYISNATSSLFTMQLAKYELWIASGSYSNKLINGDIVINNKI